MRVRKDYSQGKTKSGLKPDEKRKRTVADKGNRASRIAGRGGESTGFVPKDSNMDAPAKRKYVRKDVAAYDERDIEKATRPSSPSKAKRDERSKAYFKKEADSTGERKKSFRDDDFKPEREFKPKAPIQIEEKGRELYKKKRSFTKNKTFRETAETDQPKREYKGDDLKPYERKEAASSGGYKGKRPRVPFVSKKDKYADRDAHVKGSRFLEPTPSVDGRFKKKPKNYIDRVKFDKTDHFDARKRHSAGLKADVKGERMPYDGVIRLNKFIANSGLGSRREADEMIEAGLISVNGEVVITLGYKVNPEDVVRFNNTIIKPERNVYVLLNKPKDYISTTDDPLERKTVMLLVEKACKERIYPVGRLDRNTTGVILMTNDGELTKKLTHPSYNIMKVYHVELDRKLTQEDFEKIREGLELEDGVIKVDDIGYMGDGISKKEVELTIHSGKNHIVRRIFEHLEYKVVKLDRLSFAGLTKTGVKLGGWRYLTEQEVGFLRMQTGDKEKKTPVKRRK